MHNPELDLDKEVALTVEEFRNFPLEGLLEPEDIALARDVVEKVLGTCKNSTQAVLTTMILVRVLNRFSDDFAEALQDPRYVQYINALIKADEAIN